MICFTNSTVVAQHPATAPSTTVPSATRDDIMSMFATMNLEAQTRQVMEQVMQQMRTMNREQIKKRRPEVTEEELARIDKESEEVAKGFPVNEMLEDMVPVYQKHLNKMDVDAIIAFYSSPTGKKMLREMPAMMSEGMQAAYPRMQRHLDAIMKRMDEKEPTQSDATGPGATVRAKVGLFDTLSDGCYRQEV
jgi:hypothetical protein